MSMRVSRVGTADKHPTVEENVGRLEVKMKEMEKVKLFKSEIKDIKDTLIQTISRIETFEAKQHEEKAGLGKRLIRNEESIQQ